MLALLASRYRDVDLADEAVQDAMLEAARTWQARGIPSNPAAWLFTAANRKAIDRLRRATAAHRATVAAAQSIAAPHDSEDDEPMIAADAGDVTPIGDEQLRLMLLCCHPALDRDAQVALTLRLVGGLQTPEIAAAFVVPEATLAQRIVRAKRKIRDARIPLSLPSNLDERIDVLLTVIYLVFNEGYLTRGGGPQTVRVNLVDEAIRLTALVCELCPDHAEARGLLALELFDRARFDARLDAAGDIVLLEDQDRSHWDLPMIRRANAALAAVMAAKRPGAYQVQALIASYHANARTAADTDWVTIVRLYRQLLAITPSPVVALNHAVAVAMADGPHAGLQLIDSPDIGGRLDNYHLLQAARGELLLRGGDAPGAAAAFERALTLASSVAERAHLRRRLDAVRDRHFR